MAWGLKPKGRNPKGTKEKPLISSKAEGVGHQAKEFRVQDHQDPPCPLNSGVYGP